MLLCLSGPEMWSNLTEESLVKKTFLSLVSLATSPPPFPFTVSQSADLGDVGGSMHNRTIKPLFDSNLYFHPTQLCSFQRFNKISTNSLLASSCRWSKRILLHPSEQTEQRGASKWCWEEGKGLSGS